MLATSSVLPQLTAGSLTLLNNLIGVRMLTITIEGEELFNDETQEFSIAGDAVVIHLEHSLLSVSKWESKYQKPFLSSSTKSPEEIFDYIKAMIIDHNLDPDVLVRLSRDSIDEIQQYIESTQSATTFGGMPERRGPGEVITSELIYYWMVAFTIPFECETWHLNRLFSLIRICNAKSQTPKKMGRHEVAQQYRDLNAKRRAELGTKG